MQNLSPSVVLVFDYKVIENLMSKKKAFTEHCFPHPNIDLFLQFKAVMTMQREYSTRDQET
jgi:hypothetical protein